jgi:hypothetical protein
LVGAGVTRLRRSPTISVAANHPRPSPCLSPQRGGESICDRSQADFDDYRGLTERAGRVCGGAGRLRRARGGVGCDCGGVAGGSRLWKDARPSTAASPLRRGCGELDGAVRAARVQSFARRSRRCDGSRRREGSILR